MFLLRVHPLLLRNILHYYISYYINTNIHFILIFQHELLELLIPYADRTYFFEALAIYPSEIWFP